MDCCRIPALLVAVCLLAGGAMGQQASAPISSPQSSLPPGLPSVSPPFQAITPNEQGATLLQQTISAQNGATPVTDVTLTGSIILAVPSGGTETGTVTMTAIGDAQSQVTITSPSGTRTGIRSISPTGVPSQKSIASDGTVNHAAPQSLFSPHPGWFFPSFAIKGQPQNTAASSFIATETRNGTQVNHLRVWQSQAGAADMAALASRFQTQFDLYLDPVTSLPASTVYLVHGYRPDKPISAFPFRDVPVPVEMRFSDYRSVQGHPVAFRIQVLLQGRLVQDIQLTSATFNTGVVLPSAD